MHRRDNMPRALLLGCCALSCTCATAVFAQVIDHRQLDSISTLPQATMDAIGQQTWLFTHASVGGNIISGLDALHSANPTRYQLVIEWVGDDGARANDPPAATVPGTIYDCDRGNPGWEAKIAYFDDSVRVSGWHNPAVAAALNKLCFIDQDADATAYVDSMAALETSYPATRFVYATMPLTTSSDSDNVRRNEYNAAVRAFCTAQGKLLLDVADIEAHAPSGAVFTFNSGGQTYQRLYSGYAADEGHLNDAGSQRVALGWYAAADALVGGDPCADGNCDGPVLPDADQDGVPDASDVCPDTPTGTAVDSTGCPITTSPGPCAPTAAAMLTLTLVGLGATRRLRR